MHIAYRDSLLLKYIMKRKEQVSPLQAIKNHGDVAAIVHIFEATALGRGREASPAFGRLYPGKPQVLILQEAEWTPGPSEHERVKTTAGVYG